MSAKHTPGHKRGSVGITLGCECGWRSATFFGKGALKNANGDWQSHVEQHRASTETLTEIQAIAKRARGTARKDRLLPEEGIALIEEVTGAAIVKATGKEV